MRKLGLSVRYTQPMYFQCIVVEFIDGSQKIKVYEIYFNDIVSIELIEMGNAMNDSIYKINSSKPDAWLQIALSTENRGDVKFIEALRAKIKRINHNKPF